MLSTLAFLLTFTVVASAQYTVPTCAATCARNFPGECGLTASCLCNHQSWVNDVSCCIQRSCSSADQATTFRFASQLCGYVNIAVPTSAMCQGLNSPIVQQHPATPPTTPAKAPGGYTYMGCYSDNIYGQRTLNTSHISDTSGMTVEKCTAYCTSQNHHYAGVEYSKDCWCSGKIENGGTRYSDNSNCNLACTGNQTETCGGVAMLNIYHRPL